MRFFLTVEVDIIRCVANFGSESQKNLNMLNEVNKIYNFIFNNSSNTFTLVISEEAMIEWSTGYRDTLIKSCALLSSTVKYEDKINND